MKNSLLARRIEIAYGHDVLKTVTSSSAKPTVIISVAPIPEGRLAFPSLTCITAQMIAIYPKDLCKSDHPWRTLLGGSGLCTIVQAQKGEHSGDETTNHIHQTGYPGKRLLSADIFIQT